LSQHGSSDLFDRWSENYDEGAGSGDAFPFVGYEDVLTETVKLADVRPGMEVLDLGTGTGNLAAPFVAMGCRVWGLDSLKKMLEKAEEKVPEAIFVKAGILEEWPADLMRRYDRVVCGYVLHGFEPEVRTDFLQRLARDHLKENGLILAADIAFPNVHVREEARKRWERMWDDDEFYWAADEAMASLEKADLKVDYTQVSSMGGVFVIRRDAG
jgi:putative AdoMet-dependent methyltransferase